MNENSWNMNELPQIEQIVNEKIIEVKKAEVTKKNKKYLGVTTSKVRVRNKPSYNSKIVRIAKRGEDLGFVEQVGEWIKIKDGFIKADYVELNEIAKL